MLKLISEPDAVKQFLLKSQTSSFDSWQYDSFLKGKNIVYSSGNLNLEDNLFLDYDDWDEDNILYRAKHDYSLDDFKQTTGLIVDGDLIVDGSVINKLMEGGPFLFVTGNIKARNLIGGGAEIVIKKDALIEEFIWGHYNDGILSIRGDANCPIIVCDDHDLSIYGDDKSELNIDIFDGEFFDEDLDEDQRPIPDIVSKHVVSELNLWEELVDEVFSGNYVLSRNQDKRGTRSKEEWLNLVSANGMRLSSVPQEHLDTSIFEAAIKSKPDAIQFVSDKHINRELCMLAVSEHGWSLKHIPEKFKDKELSNKAIENKCDLESLPDSILHDSSVLKNFLLHNGYSIGDLIERLGEKALTNELVAAAIMGDCGKNVPEKFANDETALETLKYGINSLKLLPPFMVSKAVLDEAEKKFGKEESWSEIVDDHKVPKKINEDNFELIWQAFLTESNCIDALKKGVQLYEIPLPLRTKKVCDEAIKKDLFNFSWMPHEHMTKELCLKAVKHDYGCLLENVPEHLQSEELYLESIRVNGSTIEHVPEKNRSVKVCIAALMSDTADLIQYVPESIKDEVLTKAIEENDDEIDTELLQARAQARFENKEYVKALEDLNTVLKEYDEDTEAYFLRTKIQQAMGNEKQAVLDAKSLLTIDRDFIKDKKEDGVDAKFIKDLAKKFKKSMPDEDWKEVIKSNPVLIEFLPANDNSANIVNAIAKENSELIAYIPDELKTAEIYLIGLKEGDVDFEDIPEDKLSEAHCIEHVSEWGSNLCDIPDKFLTEAVCVKAVYKTQRALEFVPEELKETVKKKAGGKGLFSFFKKD